MIFKYFFIYIYIYIVYKEVARCVMFIINLGNGN